MTGLEWTHYHNRRMLEELASKRNRGEVKGLRAGNMARAAYYAASHQKRAHTWILCRLQKLAGIREG